MYVEITGTVGSAGEFTPGWWIARPEDATDQAASDGPGRWQAVALDATDVVLVRSPAFLTPQLVCPGNTQWRLSALLAVPDDARSVAVLHETVEVLRREIPHPARVEIGIDPGARLRRGANRVEVHIGGPPPGPGSYLVAYWERTGQPSMPLGLTPLGPDQRPALTLDLTTLPGGDDCQLVVTYFDGIRQTIATVDGLSLEPRRPVPVIVSPAGAPDVLSNAQLNLRGVLNGDGDPESLEWLVDGHVVGTGSASDVAGLSPGTHTITLRLGAAEASTGIVVHPPIDDEPALATWEPPWRARFALPQ